MKIPLSNPDITRREIKAVTDVLRTPHLSLGPKLEEFENKFADYIGRKYAIAVNSGTSALHLCIRSFGIGVGNEVITSPFSFIASANCMLFEGAKPVFVDIREDTLNIDEDKIEEKITAKTKAILPVHVFGYPCEMNKIKRVAKKHKLVVIEDSCEAIGAEIGQKMVGTFGDASVFAFYPNKQMTTGEGGMLLSDDIDIYHLAKSLRNQGRDEGAGWHAHSRLGYNYRLSDINCALGIVQLSRIEEMLKKREQASVLYDKYLSDCPDIILPSLKDKKVKRSWFVYVIRLNEEFSEEQRNKIITLLRGKGIGCSAYFPPIHLQSFYVDEFSYKAGVFPITEAVAARTIALPFFNLLTVRQIEHIAESLKNSIRKVK